jgi:hypothetical protein
LLHVLIEDSVFSRVTGGVSNECSWPGGDGGYGYYDPETGAVEKGHLAGGRQFLKRAYVRWCRL